MVGFGTSINWQTHAISKADLTPWRAPLLRFFEAITIATDEVENTR
jgi:hypothetical protein